MKNRIADIISKYKKQCDLIEIRVEEFNRTEIAIRGPRIEMLREAQELGGAIRVYLKGGMGFMSFNDLSVMDSAARKAIDQARIAGRSRTVLADVPVVRDDYRAPIDRDPRDVPLPKKLEILKQYNDMILNYDSRIILSSIRYRDEFKVSWFANSEGSDIRQERLDIGCNFAARAGDASGSQMAHVGTGSSRSFDVVMHREDELREACGRAVELLGAPTIRGGKYTVVIDPHLAGTFVHEAFGHSSEAEKVYENEHLAELMKIGAAFGSPVLNIYDSGITEGSRGFVKYDEEGVAARHTELIRDGILVGRLHTRETAGKMKEAATGSARAVDYRYPPVPRMRNTCIAPGRSTLDEMLDGIELGVYAADALGGQSEEMFTFTAGYGRMIRKGKLCELVKNVTLSGNLFTTLKDIDMVGSDFRQLESGGGCGKGGGRLFQFPLPTGTGAPHIRIQNVVIGGN